MNDDSTYSTLEFTLGVNRDRKWFAVAAWLDGEGIVQVYDTDIIAYNEQICAAYREGMAAYMSWSPDTPSWVLKLHPQFRLV